MNVLIIGLNSDLACRTAKRWLARGWNIWGITRNPTSNCYELEKEGVSVCYINGADFRGYIGNQFYRLSQIDGIQFDMYVNAIGTLEPLGAFKELDFNSWERGFTINFQDQLFCLHAFLNEENLFNKNCKHGPLVAHFSGGGLFDAPTLNSSYTLAKIGLVKATEILSEELPEIRFITVGVGMQATKLHRATLKAASRAGEHYNKTLSWLAEKTNHDVDLAVDRLTKLLDFALSSPKEIVTGRNWSLYWDDWENIDSEQKPTDSSLKLRKTNFSY